MRVRFLSSLVVWAGLIAFDAGAQEGPDLKKGARVFKKCKACHQVGETATNRIGPHLNAVFGRQAGGLEGFKYSVGMTQAGADGLVWSDETLDAFLKKPKSVVAKTKMSFAGLKKEKDRLNLIAYLGKFSGEPADIPIVAPKVTAATPDLDPAILALVGDVEYGEYLSGDCKTCHKSDGANDGIPGIIGWPTEDFVTAMHAYKQKKREHPVMQMMAGRLSNEEIAALAAYFNALE